MHRLLAAALRQGLRSAQAGDLDAHGNEAVRQTVPPDEQVRRDDLAPRRIHLLIERKIVGRRPEQLLRPEEHQLDAADPVGVLDLDARETDHAASPSSSSAM